MNSYFFLPILFLKFWYINSACELFAYAVSLNRAFFKLFSLPLMIKTFFQPLKNEYRPGLVRFSRAMGMVVKSILIVVDVLILTFLLTIEVAVLAGFLAFPILTGLLLFW